MIHAIFLFPNGCSAVFDEHGQQVPHYQVPWIRTYLDHIPYTEVADGMLVTMPDLRQVRLIKEAEQWNWEFVHKHRPDN